MANLTIRKHVPDFDGQQIQSYDMTLEVIDAEDIPAEIFVFETGVAPARTPEEEASDFFVHVASPVDLEELPIGSAEPIALIPFYRLPKITLKFRSLLDLEETWEYIKQDIHGLILAVNTGIAGGTTEDVEFR